MDNAYYILAKKRIDIERFHICTWELSSKSSYIEFGMEFKEDSFNEDGSLILYLAVPFIKQGDNVICLLDNLADSANSRFIFNDVVKGIDNIGEDKREGCIIRFESRGDLTILPCETNTEDGFIKIVLKKPQKYQGNMYVRILVEMSNSSIAIKKTGIARSTYIYDFKINETRNIPQNIYDLKNSRELQICRIVKLFCLHAVPDSFEFNFVDNSKLQNIRKLETNAFQHYLPEIKDISSDCYNIIFYKDGVIGESNKSSYSLFTICSKESIGSKQIALAVAANIICSLLFALSSLRFVKNTSIAWYFQIPWEYWMAMGVLILLCLYLFIPFKKKI